MLELAGILGLLMIGGVLLAAVSLIALLFKVLFKIVLLPVTLFFALLKFGFVALLLLIGIAVAPLALALLLLLALPLLLLAGMFGLGWTLLAA